MKLTADDIRNAALNYNDVYPDATDDILNGTPVVRVIITHDRHSGRRTTLTRNVGIIASDGGFIGASTPDVTQCNTPHDGGLNRAFAFAKRVVADDTIKVEVVRR